MAFFWVSISKLLSNAVNLFVFVRSFKPKSQKQIKNEIVQNLYSRSNTVNNISIHLPTWYGLSVSGKEWKCQDTDSLNQVEVIHNVTMAAIAVNDFQFQHAESLLRKTLNISRDIHFLNGSAHAYDMLSYIAMCTGNAEESERYLLEAIDFFRTLGTPEDDNLIINFKLKLAKLQFNKGNDKEADTGFKHCLNIQKEKKNLEGDEDTRILMAMILYSYGKFLMKKEKFQEAKTALEDCYCVTKNVTNMQRKQRMLILYNLGELCHVLGEFENALAYFTEAVAVYRNSNISYAKLKEDILLYFERVTEWLSQQYRLASCRRRNHECENDSYEYLYKLMPLDIY